MERFAVVMFILVAVGGVLTLFFAFPEAPTGLQFVPVPKTAEECRYDCAIALNTCAGLARADEGFCNQPRNVCVQQRRTQEYVCNEQYWKCRADCAQPLGAALLPFR